MPLTQTSLDSTSASQISSPNETQGSQQVKSTKEAAALTGSKAQALQHMSSLGTGQTTTEHQNVAAKGQSGGNAGAQVVSAGGKTPTQPANALTEEQKFGTTFNTGNKALDDLLTDFLNVRNNVTIGTAELEQTCDNLTANLNSFGTRFHNFVDRAVNHLLNLLPSFKFVDKSINNIQDRQYDYNLKTNQLSTIHDSITIIKESEEIYKNTKNLEAISTFFSDLKESTTNAFKPQSEENDLTASLSRGNISSDNHNNKYSLYKTTNGNQTNVFDGIKNSIDALTKLDKLDQIQDKDLKTILKAGIANIFAEENNNKTILEALKENLKTAETQLKKASSVKQRISAWWNSVGSNKTRFILKDGQYVEILKNKSTQKYEDKDGNEKTKNDVILANKALHDSREALRADIAEYQKQIKELKKLTNTCKEIRHTFEKSNDKAINILSNLSFVPTEGIDLYNNLDFNIQILSTVLPFKEKIYTFQQILKKCNPEENVRTINNAVSPATDTRAILHQFKLLQNKHNLLDKTRDSLTRIISLDPGNDKLKELQQTFNTQVQAFNNLIKQNADQTVSISYVKSSDNAEKLMTLNDLKDTFQLTNEFDLQPLTELNQSSIVTTYVTNRLNDITSAVADKDTDKLGKQLDILNNFLSKNHTNLNFSNIASVLSNLQDKIKNLTEDVAIQREISSKISAILSYEEMYKSTNQIEAQEAQSQPIDTNLSEISATTGKSTLSDQNVSITAPTQSVSQPQTRTAAPLPSQPQSGGITPPQKQKETSTTVTPPLPPRQKISTETSTPATAPASATPPAEKSFKLEPPSDTEETQSLSENIPAAPPAPPTGVSAAVGAKTPPLVPPSEPQSAQGGSVPSGRAGLLQQTQQGTTLRSVERAQKGKPNTSTPTAFAGLKTRIEQNMKRKAELESKSSSQTATQTSMPLEGTSQEKNTNPLLDFSQDFSD